MAKAKVPSDLRKPGAKMWREVTDEYELNPTEQALLLEACRTLDELEVLRESLLDSDLISKGSTGQPVVNKLFDEARKHRDSLSKTLAALALPLGEGEEKAPSVFQQRASKAANTRWAGRNLGAV